ncbi:PREDICTED: uncharacterized protein LOC105567976 [Vollenhovia emeryi]|uniref:uncharacterized protein LOC105567976 n=1 Tax=Vollenhovia emeryi TaxID=411798 RepID=UPI0005F3DC80|nr:PREDICTED: uncharacterized protein LOC105567976 [Vollenhovia emeryi]
MYNAVHSLIFYRGGKFTMQSVILRYYRINKTFMSQIGVWPYQSRTLRILIPCTIVLIDLSYITAEIIGMLDSWGNIDIAVECIFSILFLVGCFAKLFNLIFKTKEMRHLFSLIEYHWQVFTNSTDIEIMEDYVTFGRKVVIFYATYIYLSMLLYLIIPVSPQIMDIVMPLNVSRPRRLLLEVEYRVDQEKYYYPILFHSYMTVLGTISIMVCVDTTYIAYVQHGCSLFAAVGYQLEHNIVLKEDVNETSHLTRSKKRTHRDVEAEDICVKEKTIFRELVMCLRKHQLAIQYVYLLESSFMISTGIQVLCNVICASLIGIQLISKFDNTEELIRYICLCVGAFFHLLFLILPGQRLMDHSLNVFNSACRSYWYAFSLKNKKILQILLYRSITPCMLTAGKIYVMSMANYKKYYAINILFLSRIGGWPYQRKIIKILVPCLLTIMLYSNVTSQVFLLYDTWGDIDIAVECTIGLTLLFGCNVKLFNIILNNDKFRQLLQLMNEHWELFNNEYERYILRYYASIGQKVTNYFAVYFIISLIIYLLIPLVPRILDIVIPLNESRPLAYIYQAEYRVDKEKYYYPIILHSYISTILIIVILFAIDTTYIVCVLHTCSLFTAISQRIENIIGEADIKSDNNEKIHTKTHYHLEIFITENHGSTDNDYCELMMCLKKHQLAIEHAQMLDSMFTHATFILLFLNVLLLSVMGIELINDVGHTEELIRHIFVTFVVFTQLVCMCIPGQLLIDQSTEIFNKACSSRWYSFSIKTRRLLRILLYRSLVPCTLTAGKMFVMSMTMCSSTLLPTQKPNADTDGYSLGMGF